jgi:hypothetical protein
MIHYIKLNVNLRLVTSLSPMGGRRAISRNALGRFSFVNIVSGSSGGVKHGRGGARVSSHEKRSQDAEEERREEEWRQEQLRKWKRKIARQESNLMCAAHHFESKDATLFTPSIPTASPRMRKSAMCRKGLAVFSPGFVPYETIRNVITCKMRNTM